MSQIQRGEHLCLLYQNPPQPWPFVASFFQRGVEGGEQCLYVAEEHMPEAILAALAAHSSGQTLSVENLRQQGQLLVQPVGEGSLVARPFSAAEAIVAWQSAAEAALAAGFQGLRLVVDMSWVLRDVASLAQLAEYEARAEHCFAARNITAVCLYNQRRFPEEILLDALRTHPLVALEGVIHKNIFYLPPDILLRQDRQAQFYWRLAILGESRVQISSATSITLSEPVAKISPWEAASRQPENRSERSDELPPRWQIYCLGELRVYHQDGMLVNWGAAKGATRKVKTLFAYLLERGKVGATLEQLADLLWPDKRDMKKALGRLYHTIHALRLALEPHLSGGRASHHVVIHEGRCFLRLPDETWTDVAAFEQFCYRGERQLAAGDDENALACYLVAHDLYAGDLLADIPLAYVERIDDDWCWSRRYWLQEMALKLLISLAGIYRRRGDTQKTLGYSRSALALAPCNEAAHREMMRVFHQTGRPDALERQYHLCQEVLRRHEGRQPDAETRRLYENLTQVSGQRD